MRKMKKGWVAVALLSVAVMFAGMMTACGPTEEAHTLVKKDAVAATCTAAGNSAYYTCSDCDKLFSDAAGKTEITIDKTVIAALGHDMKTKHDGERHWTECSRCNETSAKEAHKGGAATTDKKAVCEVCGVEYGEFAAHAHDFNKQTVAEKYLKTAATCTAKAVYYMSCACGEKGTATFESGNALGHDLTVARHDTAQHWNKCSRCDETSTKENHRGGTATADKKAVCEVCGTEYGEFAPHEHVYDREVATEIYLQTAETCTAKAVYYKSCGCGGKGTATFESGEALGHDFVINHDAAQHWTECGRCDETTPKENHKPDREEFYDHDQVCTICDDVLESAILKTLDTPIEIAVSRDLDLNNSKGITNGGSAAAEIFYDGNTHAANLYTFSGEADKYLIVKGGGIVGTADNKTALNPYVGYIFENKGETPITFKYYYESNGKIPGTTEMITLAAGEIKYVEFSVNTNIYTKQAWTRIYLGAAVTDAKLALSAYQTGTMRADAYSLTLPASMTFADGTSEKIVTIPLANKLCKDIDFTVTDGASGFRNAANPAQVWTADANGKVSFEMPANDVVLVPFTMTGEWAAKKITPRVTGGSNPPLNVNISQTSAGTVDITGEGYSEVKALYTIDSTNAGKAGTNIVSGCGSFMGNSNDSDRLARITFTRVSGEISFTHYISSDNIGKEYSTFDVNLSETDEVVTAYFVIPKGLNMGEGKHIFMTLLADMTADASFVMECATIDID